MGNAWMALCGAFGLHIADEALTGFLPMYNDAVRELRARWPLLPIPTFRYDVWLIGLIAAWVCLATLSRVALRNPVAMVIPGFVFGGIMTGNGCVRIVGSFKLRRPALGTYSAPLLIVCGVWLLVRSIAQA